MAEGDKKDKPEGAAGSENKQDQKGELDAAAAKKKAAESAPELSAEDAQLKKELEEQVKVLTTVEATEASVRLAALARVGELVRTSTTSMTSIPKPLKFLRPHYASLKEYYDGLSPEMQVHMKAPLADLLSVLGITMSKQGSRDTLHYLLEARRLGLVKEVGFWGHEYVRHLTGELGEEWQACAADLNRPGADLQDLVAAVVRFNMQHSAETDAVDLLMEVDRLADVGEHLQADNCERVCAYLAACADYMVDVREREDVLKIVLDGYLKCQRYAEALLMVIRMGAVQEQIDRVFDEAKADPAMVTQLGFILGAHRVVPQGPLLESDDALRELVGNAQLNSQFLSLAREMDVLEPKTPEDIYKSHLAEGSGLLPSARRNRAGPRVDSAKQNLASTFVNAFVNLGFGSDKLVTPPESDWVFKNRDHGMLSAVASLGSIMLWDLERGFSVIDKYSYSNNPSVRAGSLLATGILSSGVTSEMDAAMGLMLEHLDANSNSDRTPEEQCMIRSAAALGLGLAYAGSPRSELEEPLVLLCLNSSLPMQESCMAALALGLIFVATNNENVVTAIYQAIQDRSDTDLTDSSARLMGLAIGLVVLGHGEDAEVVLDILSCCKNPTTPFFKAVVETCAFAGTGNVLAVQRLLALAGVHAETRPPAGADAGGAGADAGAAGAGAGAPGGAGAGAGPAAGSAPGPAAAPGTAGAGAGDVPMGDANEAGVVNDLGTDAGEDMWKGAHQAVAVLGIAMVTMHEDIGAQMALRSMDHILQYGDTAVRRAVPLAMALLSVSNPDLSVMDTLSKLTHDSDELLSQNAVLALGLIGAGTNNSRIAGLLRQLASYYAKDANHLFLVRIAQGLLHMGKGLVTLDPIHAERKLLNPVGLAGLLVVLHAALDMKGHILGKRHYLLYSLVCSARPRMLMCVDENQQPVVVKVKVGQAVDIAGQVGRAKRITGFQTHSTPVLLSHNERAEFMTDEYIPLTPVLEGVVIVRKNPDYRPEEP